MSMQCWKCVLALCAFASGVWAQAAPPQANITGEWDGKIAGKLRVILRLEKNADGPLHGVLESPDQGGAIMPIDQITFDGKRAFRFDWKSVGAIYEGELSGNGAELNGTWQQGAARVPLILRRPGAEPAAVIWKLKPVTRGSVPLQPCLAADGAIQALCGTVEVYENRATRTGRKIALNIMILPALTENPPADPIFGFAGGPGGDATHQLALTSFVVALQKQRDIVLIDQRGTGKSNPLRCPFDPKDIQRILGHPDGLDKLTSCRDELEKRADLTQYTTSNSSDDVDEVRAAFGYEKINVVGGSYGSLAALDYLRRHSSHVRAIAIEGVVPSDYRLPLPFAKTIQGSLEHLFADCAADPDCHKDFPKLKEEFESIVKRLDREPAKFDFQNGPSDKLQIILSRGAFVTSLRTLLYQPSVVSALPYIIDRAYQNDWSGFAGISVATQRELGEQVARGMAYSVVCSESVPFISERDIKRETDGTYLGDFDIRLYQKRCAVWPKASAAKDFIAPVRSDVPALLIGGDEDPATPSATARHAAEGLSHSRVIAIPYGTHTTGSACIDNLFAQFIDAASANGIDAGCVDQIRNPPFLSLDQVKKARAQNQ
jgi:pimeloyl-ACP methyl ester carboxylesterase